MLSANALHLGTWVDGLRPVRAALLKPLAAVFLQAPSAERREVAALVLADYAADRPELLAELLPAADERQFAILLPKLEAHPNAAGLLEGELRREPAAGAGEADRVALARRQANAAAALLRLGRPEPVWPLLRFSPDPTRRSYLVQRLSPLGVEARVLAERLRAEPDATARRALILALGEYGPDQLPRALREPLTAKLLEWYRTDPDRGVHGAIDWLLRHPREGPDPRKLDWGQGKALRKIDDDLKGVAPPPGQRWQVARFGLTLALFPGPVTARLGSSPDEPGRFPYEVPHERRINRSFALATKPVTVAQWEQFRKAYPRLQHHCTEKYSPVPGGPVIAVTWYEAAMFCRWLSDQERIDENQMCYPPIAEIEKYQDGQKPLKLPDNYLARTGYRLPTEAEWEYACRAETVTGRYYGGGEELLPRYGWFVQNAHNRSYPVGQKRPNDFGLFDMHGNVWNWCQEGGRAYEPNQGGKAADDAEDHREVWDRVERVLRGGSFYNLAVVLRSAYRYGNRPTFRNDMVGLRVARTLP
jgi:formylglycine-generating enzyme required for sulfatase activity